MPLASLSFLYAFFPVFLIACFLTPAGGRKWLVLGANLLFFACFGPTALLALLLSVGVSWAVCLVLQRKRGAGVGRAILIFAGVCHMGALLLLRYGTMAVETVNRLGDLTVSLPQWTAPVGMAVYTIVLMEAEWDAWKGVGTTGGIGSFAARACFFPALTGGVALRLSEGWKEVPRSVETAAAGVRTFLCGLGKVAVLANLLWQMADGFHRSAEGSVLYAWIYAVSVTLGCYYVLSGWADMAVGLGRLAGVAVPENFSHPMAAASPLKAARGWEMTVTGVIGRHLPAGLAFVLTGLWLVPGWNALLWGALWWGSAAMEKRVGTPRPFLGRIWVIALFLIGSVALTGDGLMGAFTDIGALVGWGGRPLLGPESLYQLRSGAIVLLLCAAGTTSLPVRLWRKAAQWKWMRIVEPLCIAACIAVITGFLAEGGFDAWFSL